MRKQAEPDLEFALIQLRSELEHVAFSEMTPAEVDHFFGFCTIAKEAAIRAQVEQLRETGCPIGNPDGSVRFHTGAELEPWHEALKQQQAPANVGSAASLNYMRWRTKSNGNTFVPLDYRPEPGHRGDHVALALARLSFIWHREWVGLFHGAEGKLSLLGCPHPLRSRLRRIAQLASP